MGDGGVDGDDEVKFGDQGRSLGKIAKCAAKGMDSPWHAFRDSRGIVLWQQAYPIEVECQQGPGATGTL